MSSQAQLKTFLEPFSTNLDQFIDELMPLFKLKTYKTGEVLLRPDEVCKKASVLVSGITRNFFYKKGKEITTWFDFEGDFIGSLYSFLTQTPAIEGIEVVENTVIYEIAIDDFRSLAKENKAFKAFTDDVVLYFIKNLEARGRILQASGAQERYHSFITRHPNSSQKIPAKYIASFLGITPETLSRIKTNTY
jgi:CRP/FNR family transcriptional regulator, anaerobic regulatory protein